MTATADQLRRSIYAAVRAGNDKVYVNPTGVVVVPHGRTSVFVHIIEADGLVTILLRAPILQNVPRNAELIEAVALQATLFRLGSLYLFPEGEGYDLEFESRTLARWMPAEELVDLIALVGATAEEQAHILRPLVGGSVVHESEEASRRVFAEAEMTENKVVADALVGALDTQRTTIMGAAEGAWMTDGDAVLGRAVFAMTATDLWLAGWPRYAAEPAVWRFPYRDIIEDHVRHENGACDYLARVRGSWLGVRMIDPRAAAAMARVRASPTA